MSTGSKDSAMNREADVEEEEEKEGEEEREKNDRNDDEGDAAEESTDSTSEFLDDDYEDEDEYGYDEEEADAAVLDAEMPLLKYARVTNALPRRKMESTDTATATGPLRTPRTCGAVGRVIVTTSITSSDGAGLFPSLTSSSNPPAAYDPSSSSRKINISTVVYAVGFEDGNLFILDPQSSLPYAVASSSDLRVPPSTNPSATSTPSTPSPTTTATTTTTTTTASPSPRPPAVAVALSSIRAIVDVGFDSSGTCLAAINASGDCAVFELTYTAGPPPIHQHQKSSSTATTGDDGGGGGAIASFFSAFSQPTSTEPPPLAKPPPATQKSDTTPNTANGPILQATVSTSRFSYPRSKPTCLAIDPSYRRRREKCVAVGFEDGRLILTRRGNLFNRRNDAVLYQGVARGAGGAGAGAGAGAAPTNAASAVVGGIEALEWRGGLLAWADGSGVKIFDVETMTRIAHVDRPSGARQALYPTVSALRPSLIFERSNSLLIAWGDCIMNMCIREVIKTTTGSSSSTPTSSALPAKSSPAPGADAAGGSSSSAPAPSASSSSAPAPVVLRRTVECNMAWELDCVACDVVPIDSNHVAVLGLVPVPSENDDDPSATNENRGVGTNGNNILELQIISRTAGTVTSSDALPLLGPSASPTNSSRPALGRKRFLTDSAISYGLVSSFATPRMEDAIEAEEDQANNINASGGADDFDFQFSMFGAGGDSPDAEKKDESNKFLDPHMKWSIGDVTCADDDEGFESSNDDTNEGKEDDDDSFSARSTDSDDYAFLFHPETKKTTRSSTSVSPDLTSSRTEETTPNNLQTRPEPPKMIVSSPYDIVLIRTRDCDDAIAHAISRGRHGLALRRGLNHRRSIRRHDLDDLVDAYLSSVLRMDRPGSGRKTAALPTTIEEDREVGSGGDNEQIESNVIDVRRLRMAAAATPILIGGNVEMWEKWIYAFAKIPGALFVLREHLPVRDPLLPPSLYEIVLEKMLIEVENIEKMSSQKSKQSQKVSILRQNAKDFYLRAIRAWGPTSSIRERIKMHRHYIHKGKWVPNTDSYDKSKDQETMLDPVLEQSEMDLFYRMNQTAANYLQQGAAALLKTRAAQVTSHSSNLTNQTVTPTYDALYDVVGVTSRLESRLPSITLERSNDPSPVALETMAELLFMQGNYDNSLRLYLCIGAVSSDFFSPTFEDGAIGFVNGLSDIPNQTNDRPQRYHHVLAMMESHLLHKFLLDEEFLAEFSRSKSGWQEQKPQPKALGEKTTNSDGKNDADSSLRSFPILAFIHLVGLELAGPFLTEHCVLPATDEQAVSSKTREERSTNLPIDAVAAQLRPRPKLLHWYLHRIFIHKPDLYVQFPNTAVPPRAITDLHRIHLELHIEYADIGFDQGQSLSHIPTYNEAHKESPLMAFLKAALPYGGTRPNEVRKMLQSRRGKSQSTQHVFARELAYVIETCGSGTVEDANIVLNLYLEGARSLPLAVEFVERTAVHSVVLWDVLVSFCLGKKGSSSLSSESRPDGFLFGSLLEVAARAGADLAFLVSKIPQGMRIEGLRPKLVSAVTDYRLKLKVHETATDLMKKDKVVLLREQSHRSRRGLRVEQTSRSGAKKRRGTKPLETPKTPEFSTTTFQKDGVKRRSQTRNSISLVAHSKTMPIR